MLQRWTKVRLAIRLLSVVNWRIAELSATHVMAHVIWTFWRRAMKVTYDIFRRLPGGPMWVETVQDLENAKKRLENLAKSRPGDYFLFDPSSSKIIFGVVEPARL
jgi:hypothetical protein